MREGQTPANTDLKSSLNAGTATASASLPMVMTVLAFCCWLSDP
jgi:hypothetical protein